MRVFRVLAVVALATWLGGSLLASARQVSVEPSIEEIIQSEGTASQAPYLADGDVTEAEREAAFSEWISCMEAQGVEVTGYSLDRRGGESLDVASHFADDVENSLVFECRQQYYAAVGTVYARLHGPTPQQEANEAALIAECMRGYGIDAPDGISFERLRDIDQEQALACYRAVQE